MIKINRFPAPADKFWHNWRWQMKNRITTLPQLAALLGPAKIEAYAALIATYPLAVTPYYLSLVADCQNPTDPIGRQCLPDLQEMEDPPGMTSDPLEEERNMPVAGLVQRYRDRCLILATKNCAVYCRHCNRKRLWRADSWEITPPRLAAMTEYIAARKEIREVIISGGDPLTLSDERLDFILSSFRSIPQVEVLRIGSRVPVVLPMRVTRKLCAILKKNRPLWLNTQFNHPVEITPEAKKACEMILTAGVPVSNQSVLLKGVNDNLETMRDLLQGLQRAAVRPYYLFQADRAAGTFPYHVDPAVGMDIMARLKKTISRLCLPCYVMDMPGTAGKVPLDGRGADDINYHFVNTP